MLRLLRENKKTGEKSHLGKKLYKKEIEKLREQLVWKKAPAWESMGETERNRAFKFSENYKIFLNEAKTEREAVSVILERALKKGFKNIDEVENRVSGDKFYKIHRNKTIALAVIGKEPIISGVNIIASHIDSPRLDLKQNPLYEDQDLALLKTHYYGGIRKYQWLTRPLALHGKVITGDGSAIDIKIGESDDDPVFCISDLLPHLARKSQENKKLSEVFEGEKLNLLVGSLPMGDESVKDRFRLTVLDLLFKKYGMKEEDFTSAEIEVVPAGRARDVGIDRSLVGAYGQDDRICAFTSLEAILGLKKPERTAVALFFDKEEIGSEGHTGAKSCFMEDFISDLLAKTGSNADNRTLRKSLLFSNALSADVNAALDPDYPQVHEEKNAPRIGYGTCITKFTGSGGKSGSSDADAEYLGRIRRILNTNHVVWQTGELGKIDEGGGGTIAKFLAEHGMNIVDCGPAILSMHSPFEIASKADIYMTFNAYKAFYSAKS